MSCVEFQLEQQLTEARESRSPSSPLAAAASSCQSLDDSIAVQLRYIVVQLIYYYDSDRTIVHNIMYYNVITCSNSNNIMY